MESSVCQYEKYKYTKKGRFEEALRKRPVHQKGGAGALMRMFTKGRGHQAQLGTEMKVVVPRCLCSKTLAPPQK